MLGDFNAKFSAEDTMKLAYSRTADLFPLQAGSI
jgi:hypothetical protein